MPSNWQDANLVHRQLAHFESLRCVWMLSNPLELIQPFDEDFLHSDKDASFNYRPNSVAKIQQVV